MAARQQSGASKGSWLDRAIDIFKPQPEPPPKLPTPPVDQTAWQQSVEETHIVPGLTVRDVGLSVFGEIKSFHDRPGSNEPIDAARQKVAHVIINGAEAARRRGTAAPSVALPVELTNAERRNPEVRAAYESSMNAAREAFFSGDDPTHGATHLNMRPTPDRSNWMGLPLITQSGPYDNSFVKGDVKSHTAWINTYHADYEKKK
jgi:hypothetical protein